VTKVPAKIPAVTSPVVSFFIVINLLHLLPPAPKNQLGKNTTSW
jgi:hypothetical protein